MNERIEGLVAEGQITEALAELEKYPVEQQGEAWLLYIGELYYKLGKSTGGFEQIQCRTAYKSRKMQRPWLM